ncbi:MAG TPA: flavodoxin [Lunatimonas sp.]|nr:flavodoxin [Lunatimonas sp.]
MLCTFLLSSLSSSCQTSESPEIGTVTSERILIVYLSRTKNTKTVAEIIQQKVGGTLVALELRTPYSEDYRAIVDQVARENETGFLPPLKTEIENINQYEVIYLGFPTWGMQLPPPMKSFLNQYDLSGKTIVPFNTNAGYGTGSNFRSVEELSPNANILEGYSTTGGIERDGILYVMEGEKLVEVKGEVISWLKNINMINK